MASKLFLGSSKWIGRLAQKLHPFSPHEKISTSSSPSPLFQTTLSGTVTRSGVGLHSGTESSLKLMPAFAAEGRYFVYSPDSARRQQDAEERLPAFLCNVVDTSWSTTIGSGKFRIQTVEHLLSALEGLGIDNCRMELQGGSEIPILDGSAKMWVEAISEAGICLAKDKSGNQLQKQPFVLRHPLSVTMGDSFVAAFPSPKLKVTYGIEFEEVPAIGTQWFSFCLSDASKYETEIAPARTFGIAEQIESLRAAGLVKGGSMENAIICSKKGGWLNHPLRFEDEPCRHKLLDLIGDVSLCARNGNPGVPIAHIVAFKGGHRLHTQFGMALLDNVARCGEFEVYSRCSR